jgi:reactive intermediate/imine deaminase
MAKMILQPKSWAKPSSPYSPGTQLGNLVCVAGQVSQDKDGRIVAKGDVRQQTRVAIERIREVLAEAGMTLADVMATTVYLKHLTDFQAMNEAYRELFKGDFPARATVQANLADEELLVEITAIAAR